MIKLFFHKVKENSICMIPIIIQVVFVLAPLVSIIGYSNFYYKEHKQFGKTISAIADFNYRVNPITTNIFRPAMKPPEEFSSVQVYYGYENSTDLDKADGKILRQRIRGLPIKSEVIKGGGNSSTLSDFPLIASGLILFH